MARKARPPPVSDGQSAGAATPQRVKGLEDLCRIDALHIDDDLLLDRVSPSTPEPVSHGPQFGGHCGISCRKAAAECGQNDEPQHRHGPTRHDLLGESLNGLVGGGPTGCLEQLPHLVAEHRQQLGEAASIRSNSGGEADERLAGA